MSDVYAPTSPPLPGRALCAETDPEEFFPDPGGSTRVARSICAACEVREACLEQALAAEVMADGRPLGRHTRIGILGGLSPTERAKLAKERAA